MDQEKRNSFGTWLRRTWTATLGIVEAMETARTPVEEALYRIDRLEREVAALKTDDRASLAAIADIADVGRAQSRAGI